MPGTIQELSKLIKVFDRMHHTLLRSTFDKQGLEELSNPQILFILRQQEGKPVSQNEIADCIGITPPTAAVSIKRMERAGLVNKTADEKDQRRNQITLTPKGWKLTEACHQAGYSITQSLVQGFSPQELDCLCDYYMRMIHNMEAMNIRPPAQLRKKVDY